MQLRQKLATTNAEKYFLTGFEHTDLVQEVQCATRCAITTAPFSFLSDKYDESDSRHKGYEKW